MSGQIEGSANSADLSILGGPSGLTYMLTSTDWPLKAIFFDAKDAYARTEEDNEAVRGLGLVARLTPLPLKNAVTTVKESSS